MMIRHRDSEQRRQRLLAVKRRYNRSAKGHATAQRYNASDKGKARAARYNRTRRRMKAQRERKQVWRERMARNAVLTLGRVA